MESHLILVFISTVLVTAVLGQGVYLELGNEVIPNNSVVTYNDIGLGSLTLKCVTNRRDCCIPDNSTRADWFTPSGEVADRQFSRSWSGLGRAKGYVWIFRNSSTRIADVQEGLYHCNILSPNGDTSTLYVGMYTSDIGGKPTITGITYNQLSPEKFTLTCTSTGGPATTVTWTLNDSEIIYDANHVLTQTVVNTRIAEYNNTLTVTGREPGNYQCTVSNARGSNTSQLLVVTITELSTTKPSTPITTVMLPSPSLPVLTSTTKPDTQNPSSSPKVVMETATLVIQNPSSSSHPPEVSVNTIVGFVMAAVLLVVTVVLSVVIVLLVMRLRHLSASLQKNPGVEMVSGLGAIPVEECVAYGPHSHGQQQTEDHEYETAVLQELPAEGRRRDGGGRGGGGAIYSEPAYELGVVSKNPAQRKVGLSSATEETVYERLD